MPEINPRIAQGKKFNTEVNAPPVPMSSECHGAEVKYNLYYWGPSLEEGPVCTVCNKPCEVEDE